jgi:hypothetical protein
LQGTEILFAILLLTAYCSRDVNPEVVPWSASNNCSIVYKHPVASVYHLFHIYPSLMRLAVVTSFTKCFGRTWPSSGVYHYAKTAALQGMSQFHIRIKNYSGSALINFSSNQLNPILHVGIVYLSERLTCAAFPVAWVYSCYRVVFGFRCVVFSSICLVGCRFITQPV